ncbi:ribosome production factor 2 homolog [Ornithodoros turicata]|uniref:Ribosome production factor 2 homolog n=1 Tax=Ornithodoros turicata TaxID=34597 RepID=A0A2R5LH19_9ACAR
MAVSQRILKPKTHRGKLALEKREPKITENPKTTILIRGSSANNVVVKAMKDLRSLKAPHAVVFNRKNEAQPMEDAVPIEMMMQRTDSSLFVFGSHNKKRPNNLILGRTFDGHILDMFELGMDQYKALEEFKVAKVASGIKPLLLFAGEQFEQTKDYQRLKNFLIDFFSGEQVDAVSLQGLEHVLMFTMSEEKLYVRSYKVLMKNSGTKTPRIELEEIGPSFDLCLRRMKIASDDLFKRARRLPKQAKPKKKKNFEKTALGTTLGRIHMEKQDLSKLQTRKLKGLKKTAEERKAARQAKKQTTEETSEDIEMADE